MQQDRVQNPHPWTFEIPLAVVLAVALVMVLGVHAGRAAANLLAGAGWTWPPATELVTSLPGILAGDATAGLSHPPARVAGAGALRACVVVAEILTLVAVTVAGALFLRRLGPGRLRGMATRAQATTLLGRRRLVRDRAEVRPDLYRKARR